MTRRRHVQYQEKLTTLARRIPERLDQFGRGVATQMTVEVVSSFGSGPPGETYGNHVASTAGYPPNVDTGALRGSINWTPLGRLRYMIHDGVIYGAFLEFGTSKMAARPFLSPVFERWWRRELAEAAKKAGLFDV